MNALTSRKMSFELLGKNDARDEKQVADSNFTFDLESMEKAINSPIVAVPHSAIESDESFDKWLNE
jgi:hypothetical protein